MLDSRYYIHMEQFYLAIKPELKPVHLRYGQFIFNIASEMFPEIVLLDKMPEDVDCFYLDKRITAFLIWLAAEIEEFNYAQLEEKIKQELGCETVSYN